MTASKQIKGLLAGVAAFAFVGAAMAQGNPPNPAVKSAPVGAGQQSTQKTPMGETGTPGTSAGAGAATGGGSTAGTASGTSSMGSTSSSGGSTSGTSSMGAGGSSTDSTMASSTGGTRKANRRMRADRN